LVVRFVGDEVGLPSDGAASEHSDFGLALEGLLEVGGDLFGGLFEVGFEDGEGGGLAFGGLL